MKRFKVEYVNKAEGRIIRVIEAIDWVGIIPECIRQYIQIPTILSIEILPEEIEGN